METLFWNSWGVAFSSFKQPVVCFLIERPSTWVMGLLTVFLQWGQLGGVCQYWSSLSQHLLQRSLVRVVTGMMRWWGKVLHMTMSYQYSSQHQWVIDNSTIWAEEYLQFCFLQETKTKRRFPGNLCITPRAIWAAQYTPCSVFVVTFLETENALQTAVHSDPFLLASVQRSIQHAVVVGVMFMAGRFLAMCHLTCLQ